MSTAPVIFDITYTPHHLKRGSSEKDIAKHAKERAFFTMTGDGDTIYRYMTREGKICGEHLKQLTVLEYLQKSTGVFNGDGIISKDELADMKFRAQSGEKNIWHGFISFDEEHSEKIDSPQKCIELVRRTFRPFFKEAGLDPDNVDLMCSLHLDRPTHLHIHYVFWEKEPKVKNQRAAGYKYRAKGKIKFDAIAAMTERLNAIAISDELLAARDEAERQFAHSTEGNVAQPPVVVPLQPLNRIYLFELNVAAAQRVVHVVVVNLQLLFIVLAHYAGEFLFLLVEQLFKFPVLVVHFNI